MTAPLDDDIRPKPGLVRRFWNRFVDTITGRGQQPPPAEPAEWDSEQADLYDDEYNDDEIDPYAGDNRPSITVTSAVPLDDDFDYDDFYADEPENREDEGIYLREPGENDSGDWTTRGTFASFHDVVEYLSDIAWLEYWIVDNMDGTFDLWINEETQV